MLGLVQYLMLLLLNNVKQMKKLNLWLEAQSVDIVTWMVNGMYQILQIAHIQVQLLVYFLHNPRYEIYIYSDNSVSHCVKGPKESYRGDSIYA